MNEVKPLPIVTVVVPARNEEAFIELCVRHILASDYPQDRIEVIVVDGQSDDRTAETVRGVAAKDPRVRLIENPRRITPVAFNLGIEAARGDAIFFASAHSTVSSEYFSRCISLLQEHPEVWCVGGADRVIGDGYVGRVIAASMASPVGAGNARYRLGHYKGYVDTVTGGYWRWVFDKIGLFDETLIRNQDDELNFRLRQAGGKIYLDSDVSYGYHARNSLRKLAQQYFQYGFWRMYTIQKHSQPATFRQVVPLGMVLAWIGLVLGTVIWLPVGYALAAFAALYVLAILAGAADVARKAGLRYAVLAPLAFASMHFSYGFGSLAGLWTFIILRRGGKISEVKYPLSR